MEKVYKRLPVRCFCLVLVVVSLLTGLVPAQAASYKPFSYDMLTDSSYDKYIDGDFVANTIRPSSWFSGVTSARWSWWTSVDYVFNEYYLTFRASRKPDSLKVRMFGSQNWFEGTYIGHVGNTYQYQIDIGSNVGEISIQADFNSSYTGNFDLLSFVGMRSYTNSPSKVDISARRNVMETTGINSLDTYISVSGAKIPYSGPAAQAVSGNWKSSIIDVSVTPDQRQYDFLDSVTFLVSGYALQNFTISLLDSSYNTVTILDSVSVQAIGNSTLVSQPHDYPIFFYEVSADLTGYDLEDLIIRLTFDGVAFDQAGGKRWVYFNINDVILEPRIEEIPWYKVFFDWLSSKWDKVTSSVNGAISSAADKISNAFSGNSAANQALNQAGSAMSDQADTMNQAQDQLNSVDKPELQPDNLLGNYLAFDTGGLRVLSAITSNSLVTSMLVVVFTFALCGYIFFGKKR